ncbi:MAG: Hsp20/alpha crystallin family protein [Candidatus Cybelea sp.]|jgi:HSP20 family protein
MEFVVRPRPGAFAPNADVFVDEDQRRLVVVVEVAGADPESLRVVFDERSLVIGGRRREAARLRRGSFAQKEIAHGDFVKRIPLPVAIEYERIVATYEDGFLLVLAPIAATAYLPTARTELHILVKRTHS